MKIFKFFTPFIWFFPLCIFLAFKTWTGAFANNNLPPGRAVLFVSIGFTMLVVDLFIKYLFSKRQIGYVWLLELVLLGVLAIMIVPKFYAAT